MRAIKDSFKNCKTEEKIFLGIALFISVLYAYTVSQIDCNTITLWGHDLLASLFRGELTEFPAYTFETHGTATNYSLLVNVITAISLLPIFVVEKIIGFTFNYVVINMWYKTFILVVHIIDIYLFYRILDRLDFTHTKKVKGVIYYMLSSVICITILGKGQVDIYIVTFVMLGMLCFMNEKYIYMSILMGLALVIKPFAILIVAPLYLLMIHKLRGKVIVNSIITIIPFVIDETITKLLMPSYSEYKEITSQLFKESYRLSRVEQLFNLKINNVLVFFAAILIISFIAFYIGKARDAKLRDYLVFPSLMYISYGIFVSSSSYWFIAIIPALVIMGLKLSDIREFELLYFGSNIGVVVYIYFLEKHLRPGTNYTFFDLLGLSNSVSPIYERFSDYRYPIYETGATLFLICMLIICILFYMENVKKKPRVSKDNKTFTKFCFILQYVPVVTYLVISYITIR